MRGAITTQQHETAVAAAYQWLNNQVIETLGPERAQIYGELAAEWVPAAQEKIRAGDLDDVLEVVDEQQFQSMLGIAREARFADVLEQRDHADQSRGANETQASRNE
ncbi:MAG: hypothetical protein D6689_19795 [Deltaproteobacteria bacterium]|nr:MAG: hypothetical protein D6689_19795 [Deltaproteobacteria bacterium]